MVTRRDGLCIKTLRGLAVCLILGVCTAIAQGSEEQRAASGTSQPTSTDFETALPRSIEIAVDIPTQSGTHFRCEPVTAFKAGDEVATAGGGSTIWSIHRGTVAMPDGKRSYPSLGLVRDSSGAYCTIILSVIEILKPISRNKTVRDGTWGWGTGLTK